MKSYSFNAFGFLIKEKTKARKVRPSGSEIFERIVCSAISKDRVDRIPFKGIFVLFDVAIAIIDGLLSDIN
jgi:hypothetical protein